MYGWLVRKQVLALWERLSDHELEAIPLAGDVHFTFFGDHALAAETWSAEDLRAWLRALFERYPRIRFEVDELVVGGPPWSLRTATRYRTVQDGQTLYRGAHFAHIQRGRVVEEHVLPDTQVLAQIAPR